MSKMINSNELGINEYGTEEETKNEVRTESASFVQYKACGKPAPVVNNGDSGLAFPPVLGSTGGISQPR